MNSTHDARSAHSRQRFGLHGDRLGLASGWRLVCATPAGTRRGLLGAVLLLALVLSVPRFATATPPAEEIEIARQHFAEAQRLEQEGAWQQASERLQKAIRIKETPGLRFHLAHALEQQGRLTDAAAELQRAAELIATGAAAQDVEALLEDAQRSLYARIPTITVLVGDSIESPQLELDGHVVDRQRASRPIAVDPGQHTLSVTAPGWIPMELVLDLSEGEARTVDARLLPVVRTPVRPRAPPPKSAATPVSDRKSLRARRVTFVAEGAITLAGLGVGVYYKLDQRAAADRASWLGDVVDGIAGERRNACINPSETSLAATCENLQDAIASERRAKKIAIAGFAVAGAGAAALLSTWLLWPKRQPGRPKLVFVPTPQHAMAAVTGEF
jgi:tetratricopeptide (TPR) repeat protein